MDPEMRSIFSRYLFYIDINELLFYLLTNLN
jgi:hypothetical protein